MTSVLSSDAFSLFFLFNVSSYAVKRVMEVVLWVKMGSGRAKIIHCGSLILRGSVPKRQAVGYGV